LQVTSLAANVRDLILRTRSVLGSGGDHLRHVPYPVAVVQQVAAAMGW
jgi:hypothetical protein